jgi:tRNA (cytidine/uridine-2'-O-)-methyltransferase
MNIVLYHPQIPQNTGNVVRTCAVTGCGLFLVKPLGFQITDRWLKRAGLDYWEGVQVELIDSLKDFVEKHLEQCVFFSSKGQKKHTEIHYSENSQLIFGSETAGLPDYVHTLWPEKVARIPMLPNKRCLNLATSVGIGVYEAIKGLSTHIAD